VSSRPPDLPGLCPFDTLQECPYGIRCRWASKHRNPDALTKEYLLSANGSEGHSDDAGVQEPGFLCLAISRRIPHTYEHHLFRIQDLCMFHIVILVPQQDDPGGGARHSVLMSTGVIPLLNL
jgi:hypothetical protein